MCVGALSCWRRNPVTFLWGQTVLKCLERAWVYRSELMVWPCGIMSTTITPSAFQKQQQWLPAERVALNFFFQGEVGQCHSTDYLLFVVESDGSIFIPSDDPWQKDFTIGLWMYLLLHSFVIPGLALWKPVSTHFLIYQGIANVV